jgi:hypothetical protein
MDLLENVGFLFYDLLLDDFYCIDFMVKGLRIYLVLDKLMRTQFSVDDRLVFMFWIRFCKGNCVVVCLNGCTEICFEVAWIMWEFGCAECQ